MVGKGIRLGLALVVLLVASFGARAGAQDIPPPPTIPDLPDLGKPDDMAKFRVVIEGVSVLRRDGERLAAGIRLHL